MLVTQSFEPLRLAIVGAALVSLGGFSPARQPSESGSHLAFTSADVISATDVPYPAQSIAVGTVVLEVIVSETGKVEDVRPIREIESLTEVASDSVKGWEFNPASLGGKSVRSRTAIAITFNPAAIPAANVPLPPLSLKAQSQHDTLQPQPVDVVAAAFPQYPVNSIASGTVVLRVNVDEMGRVEKTIAVRRIASLTSPAVHAVKEWKFKPAEFDGKPLASSIALAFVFRAPLPRNP
jgi:TonB family protein